MCSKSLLALCALPCPGSFLWIWNVLFHCIWKCFVPSTIGFSTPQVVNSVWFYCCYRFVGNAHFLDVLTQQTAHAIHKDHKDMKFMKISVMNIFMCAHNHIHEHSAPQFQYPTDFPCQGRYFFCTLDRRHLAIGDLNGVLWTDFTHIYLICCTTFFCIICIYIYTCMVLYFYLSIYLFIYLSVLISMYVIYSLQARMLVQFPNKFVSPQFNLCQMRPCCEVKPMPHRQALLALVLGCSDKVSEKWPLYDMGVF